MAAAILSKEENTVLIFAGRIMSKFLNNGAFISLHVVGLISRASLIMELQMFFDRYLHLETAEEIPSCVYHCFLTMPTFPWLCGKEQCLVGAQTGVVGP